MHLLRGEKKGAKICHLTKEKMAMEWEVSEKGQELIKAEELILITKEDTL